MAGLTFYMDNGALGTQPRMRTTSVSSDYSTVGWSQMNVSPITYGYRTMPSWNAVTWQSQGDSLSDTLNDIPSSGSGALALDKALTGTFYAGSWTINLAMRARTAGASGSARYRFSIWRCPVGGITTGATRIGTISGSSSSWSNLSTSSTQVCTATLSLPELTLNNENIYIRVVQELITTCNSGTAEAMIRIGETNVSTPEFKDYSLTGSTNSGNVVSSTSDLDLRLDGGDSLKSSVSTSAILNYRPAPVYLADRTDVKTNYYAMRGKDNTGYKTWIATGSPDVNGTQYTGVVNGTLTDIVVIQAWTN